MVYAWEQLKQLARNKQCAHLYLDVTVITSSTVSSRAYQGGRLHWLRGWDAGPADGALRNRTNMHATRRGPQKTVSPESIRRHTG